MFSAPYSHLFSFFHSFYVNYIVACFFGLYKNLWLIIFGQSLLLFFQS